VRVVEACGHPDLADEPLGSQHVRQLRVQDLEGHRTRVPEIAGEIDGSHPAAAELSLERVPVAEFFGELLVERRRGAA
jgi:hypothetical protein